MNQSDDFDVAFDQIAQQQPQFQQQSQPPQYNNLELSQIHTLPSYDDESIHFFSDPADDLSITSSPEHHATLLHHHHHHHQVPPQPLHATPIQLVQASFEDICDRQLLYIRGQRAIVTCIDYPLIFWRYIDLDVERLYAREYIVNDQPINVTADGLSLSKHFYQVTLSANDMGTLVSTAEYHRSYHASPSIFKINIEDKRYMQQRHQMMHHNNHPEYLGWQTYDAQPNDPQHDKILQHLAEDDWADFQS